MRVLFLQGCTAYMIDGTLGHANQHPSAGAKPPAQVNLLHVGKETAIQSAGIPIVFLTDKQGGSCNPKHRNDSIILPVVLLHYTHYPSPAEGITVAVYKSAGCSRIFKQFFLTPTPDFRLARRNLRMGVHIVYEWRQPVFGHFHIGIKQYHIFGGYLLQGKIISLGKTEIFF